MCWYIHSKDLKYKNHYAYKYNENVIFDIVVLWVVVVDVRSREQNVHYNIERAHTECENPVVGRAWNDNNLKHEEINEVIRIKENNMKIVFDWEKEKEK